MNTIQVCQLDSEGYFASITEADESPLEPGIFLIPGGCVVADPPTILDGYWPKWNGTSFEQEKIVSSVEEPEPEPTEEDLKQSIIAETQYRLDSFAKTRNYDGILSACTYSADPIEKFRVEGQYCVEMRGRTWAKLYEILDEVQHGSRPMPTSFADIEPELPALEWPI